MLFLLSIIRLSFCSPIEISFKYSFRAWYFISKTITPRFSPFLSLMSLLIDKTQLVISIEVCFFLIGFKTGLSVLFIALIYQFSFIISAEISILTFFSLEIIFPFFPITVILFILPLFSLIII